MVYAVPEAAISGSHVPGVPADVQRHPIAPAGVGLMLKLMSPFPHALELGGAVP
jgi:hypothetical protein